MSRVSIPRRRDEFPILPKRPQPELRGGPEVPGTVLCLAGQRIFNASINGQTVIINFDALAKSVKPNAAIDKAFYVAVTGGQPNCQFTPVAGEPNVIAIQVIPQ